MPQYDEPSRPPAPRRDRRRGLAVAIAVVMLVVACRNEVPVATPPTAAQSTPAPVHTASTAPDARPPACTDPCRERPSTVGSFPVRRAPEASGLVSSARHDGVLYVVDDGPGTAQVLLISAEDAGLLGRLEITGLDGTDTEALAAGPCSPAGGRCIFVGDIGNNVRGRDAVSVYRFREPERVESAQAPADRITLRYPDGPHDAEALLVDGQGRVGIVTKEARSDGAGAARLYLAPSFRDATLTDRGRVPVPLPTLPLAAAAVGNVVTGGDWAPGRVVLRTYDTVFEYRAPTGRGGLPNFPAWPVTEVAAAPEQQGEAVAYGADGCTLYTVSERSGALSAARCR